MVEAMVDQDFAVGLLHMAQGRMDQAVQVFTRIVAQSPANVQINHALGIALGKAGRLADAIDRLELAVQLSPDESQIADSLAYFLGKAGRWDALARHLRRALVKDPNNPALLTNLGLCLQHLGALEQAEAHYRQAIAQAPDFADAYGNLGVMLRLSGRLDEALTLQNQAVALKPDDAQAHNTLGTILQDLDRFQEARASYLHAVTLAPDYAEAHNNLGGVLQDLGLLDQARRQMETALALAPDNALTHYNLAVLKRFTLDDPQLSRLELLAGQGDALLPEQQAYVHFALGKAYDDLGQPDRAFRHLITGNACHRRLIAYDEAESQKMFARIQAVFTAQFIKDRALPVQPADGPLFIVGMPRSGTTLVEQILASHPQVSGGGELNLLTKAVEQIMGEHGFPETTGDLCRADLLRLGAIYETGLRAKFPQARFVTDKMPQNFFFCGLIPLVLPNARIIHLRRDPLDTCLSCFSKLFSHPMNHTYDLGELGRYYARYAALMDHWRQVLPTGMMLEVEYEKVVDDLAGETRRILDHCGLPWDRACLDFHQTDRPVRTASATQVRQPIYKTSVNRWRPASDVLKPLLDGLDRP